MLEDFIKQKESDNKDLSKQFENWLYKDRGRQIRGIEYFLNKRSENIDNLIQSIAPVSYTHLTLPTILRV